MNINLIVKELAKENIIQSTIKEIRQLNGGTVSEVHLLIARDGSAFVCKKNSPEVIKAEAAFLGYYQDLDILPRLLFVDKSHKYLVMSYISGTTDYIMKRKKHILASLVQKLISYYKVSDTIGWGYVDDVTDSWQSFLLQEVEEASKLLHPYLLKEDIDYVISLVKDIDQIESEPLLIHGDCGMHNFIVSKDELKGIIDPTPINGTPLYDLIYAYCSSPIDLTKETIDYAAGYLQTSTSSDSLYKEVLIGLFIRLGRCIKHHPEDLPAYLKAWDYWKVVVII